MRVVVASHNPVKVGATERAFQAVFEGSDVEMHTANVPSGVSDQPASDDETRQGARNRAGAASEAMPDADYWVGLEGGVEIIDGQLMAFAWMAIRDTAGRLGEARSATLPLPPAVKKLVDNGMELGDANDRVFATVNSKQGGGAYGLLTDGRYTRESVYEQTLVIALTPLVHELFEK